MRRGFSVIYEKPPGGGYPSPVGTRVKAAQHYYLLKHSFNSGVTELCNLQLSYDLKLSNSEEGEGKNVITHKHNINLAVLVNSRAIGQKRATERSSKIKGTTTLLADVSDDCCILLSDPSDQQRSAACAEKWEKRDPLR